MSGVCSKSIVHFIQSWLLQGRGKGDLFNKKLHIFNKVKYNFHGNMHFAASLLKQPLFVFPEMFN